MRCLPMHTRRNPPVKTGFHRSSSRVDRTPTVCPSDCVGSARRLQRAWSSSSTQRLPPHVRKQSVVHRVVFPNLLRHEGEAHTAQQHLILKMMERYVMWKGVRLPRRRTTDVTCARGCSRRRRGTKTSRPGFIICIPFQRVVFCTAGHPPTIRHRKS